MYMENREFYVYPDARSWSDITAKSPYPIKG